MSDTVAANDPVAVASAGVMRTDKPATPTLSVSAGTNSGIATIAGEAGCTHYLKYKASSDSEWQDGGSREGDGTITVTGLSNGVPYTFVAISKNAPGIYSLPSASAELTLAADSEASSFGADPDEVNDFLNEFGEPITYHPGGVGSRAIIAIVDREPPAEVPGMPAGAHSTRTIITVANRSEAYGGINGISSSEVNKGRDKVTLSVRGGQAAVTKRISSKIYEDAGMMKLECR